MVKKCHTIKSTVISTLNKEVKYISRSYIGKSHDFSMIKNEFSPERKWFKKFKLGLDLGYIVFENLYKAKDLIIPIKKSKNKELT